MKSTTIDMREIRYLNLFERVTGVRTKDCFFYNNMILFAVPPGLVSKAIGENGKNVRQIAEILGRKIKVISLPFGAQDAEKFVLEIIEPVKFRALEVRENEIVISASTQSKAIIIGRNKRRLIELKKIISDYFGKELRIG